MTSTSFKQPRFVFRWRLADQSLAVQFLAAGGVVAFFSIVSLVLLLSQVDSQTRASLFLSRTHQAASLLGSLGRDFYRQETALLEYLRTRDERFLSSVREQQRIWDQTFTAASGLATDNSRAANLFQDLGESYRSWRRVADSLLLGRLASNEALKNEAVLFKETFLLIDRLISLQNRQLSIRDESEKNAAGATFATVGMIQIVLMVIFAVALAKLYYSVARPISNLSVGMKRYQDGDFGARVEVSNQSQIGYLEHSFNEMAEKIEAMVKDLRALDTLKSEFISTVSHELRTPLTSIGGYAQLLAAGEAGDVTETQKEFLYIIDTNVVRLTRLINDILDVEKMELGKMQIVRSPENLPSVLKECRDTLGILAAQKGLEVRYDVPAELPMVLGDRSRLVQIFMNLLSNAIKYTDTGFVSIAAEAKDFAVLVKIRDSGIGLTAEEQARMFEKFYRTPTSLNSGEGGSGLGLVIVRGLVEAHGGQISLESTPGRGTTFTVTFPTSNMLVEPESIVQVDVPAEASDARAWKRPVWIVDSDPVTVQRMASVIENAGPLFKGYRLSVLSFAGVAAIPKGMAEDQSPFMVILDPGLEAEPHEVIPKLRKLLHRTVPILVASSTVDTAEVFAQGASALLTKPIDEREFLMAVREMVSAKGWRVLLAEKSTDLRILLKHALEQRGCLVDDVDRGSLVMSRIEQEEYDLALLNLDFTDVSARELLKVVRRGRSKETLPVLLMVDEDKNAPTFEEMESWGVNASIGKVRGISGMVESVCEYLEERKLSDSNS